MHPAEGYRSGGSAGATAESNGIGYDHAEDHHSGQPCLFASFGGTGSLESPATSYYTLESAIAFVTRPRLEILGRGRPIWRIY